MTEIVNHSKNTALERPVKKTILGGGGWGEGAGGWGGFKTILHGHNPRP